MADASEIIKFKLRHHFNQAAMANFVTCSQRVDVTNKLIRFTYISAHDFNQCLINNTTLGEFHNGDVKAFFIDTGGIRAKASIFG